MRPAEHREALIGVERQREICKERNKRADDAEREGHEDDAYRGRQARVGIGTLACARIAAEASGDIRIRAHRSDVIRRAHPHRMKPWRDTPLTVAPS